MGWGETILKAGNRKLFRYSWRLAQKIRAKVETLTEHFFEELVTIGIGVDAAPNLAQFTPTWEPLSDSWEERKGHGDFFFDKGDLERALLRKSTQGIFGRPQVYLDFNGNVVKINAGESPAKYDGQPLTGLAVRVVPFPRIDASDARSPEELVAGENSTIYFALISAGTPFNRPLVSPFVLWYTHVKIRNAIKGLKP